MHKFSCMRDAICVHVTYTVVTVHAFCEGLELLNFYPPEFLSQRFHVEKKLTNSLEFARKEIRRQSLIKFTTKKLR